MQGVRPVRLGINVDHVATLRNARGGFHPDPVRAAALALAAGADGITAHLREDRRHIRDADMARLKAEVALPLNFEMAATAEMVEIALKTAPHACCLVPEKREERTTEGGLDAAGQSDDLAPKIAALKAAGIRVSLFVAPDPVQIEAARALNADIVELHTGAWCDLRTAGRMDEAKAEFARLAAAAIQAEALGLEVHGGHGLDYQTARQMAALPEVVELNIGHYIIGEAIFHGLESVIRRMRESIALGRAQLRTEQAA
ncbi:pyridoxine 5'-phosphate synthase [Roseixanthobacter psychrophilus]|uniref:pyridoxine 5'-phosphate synthase n=1 Tax=Roseixanthobacter psychrophilus TaxID=3119917 RepID=UPI003D21AEB7